MSKKSWLEYLDQVILPGIDKESLMLAHQDEVPVSVRLHPVKGNGLYHDQPAVPWCNTGRYLSSRPDFTLDPLFHAGAYYVQEASSMSIMAALEILVEKKDDLKILDLCAAPGGKSTLIASWLNEKGLLVANETIRSRAVILADNLSKWGYANSLVSSNDPQRFSSLGGFFDVILVDAPCSGSGLFRKDPAAMEQWMPDSVKHCAARQSRILEDIWPALKEGGILLYATCSFSPEENEQMAERIKSMGGVNQPLPSLTATHQQIVTTTNGYRFYPGKIRGEGFFLAAFKKEVPAQKPKNTEPLKNYPVKGPAKEWLKRSELMRELNTHLGTVILPEQNIKDASTIISHLRVIRAGLLPGEAVGKDFIPHHDLALSLELSDNVPSITLDLQQSLHFLKKETTGIPHPGKGWFLIRYNGLGLGWIKAVPGRINNYLPKHFRILKELKAADNH